MVMYIYMSSLRLGMQLIILHIYCFLDVMKMHAMLSLICIYIYT